MAQFTVVTTKEEQDKVVKVIEELKGATTPVATIAAMAGMRPTRTRYVIIDLIEQGRIERVASKAFNKHYVRYSYNVVAKH